MRTAKLLGFVSLAGALAAAGQARPTDTGNRAAPGDETIASAYPGGKWTPGPADYGTTVLDNVSITMTDGIVLNASVTFPIDPKTGKRATGRFPVIVEHTPYIGNPSRTRMIEFLVTHGYIYAVVSVRGTVKSQGEFRLFSRRDAEDGKTVVDWAAHRLEGADGRVALVGCSFPAAMALQTAAAMPANSPVKAVIASCNGLGMQYRQIWTTYGLPTTTLSNFTSRAPQSMGNNPAVPRHYDAMVGEIMRGGGAAYDGAYWQDSLPLRFSNAIVASKIPVLLWSGWTDVTESAAIRAYVAFQNALSNRAPLSPMTPDQPVSPQYQLIMGNWGHGQGLDAGVYLEWLETWIKGVDTGLQTTRTPLHLLESGTDRWLNLARYPIVDRSTDWFIGKNGGLAAARSLETGSVTLAWGKPEASNGKVQVETDVLRDGLTIAGPMSATLYVKSTNSNLEILGHVYDVSDDGKAELVGRGAILGSLRDVAADLSWADTGGTLTWPFPKLDRDRYLRPGTIYRLDMSLAPRQWAIRPGHRIRLELTTQNADAICPTSGPAPRSDGEVCGLTDPQKKTLPNGVYTLLYGGQWPSALHLPQLPWKALPAVRTTITPTGNADPRATPDGSKWTLPLEW